MRHTTAKVKEAINLVGTTCHRPYQLLFFDLDDGTEASVLTDYDATYVRGDVVPLILYTNGRYTKVEIDG